MGLLRTGSRTATLDSSLLDAFSSDERRVAAVQLAAMGIAQRSPEDARKFVETHVADAAQRDSIQQALERMSTNLRQAPVLVPPAYGPQFGVSPPLMNESMLFPVGRSGVFPSAGAAIDSAPRPGNALSGARERPPPSPAPPQRTPSEPR
jgi:hypothetical protein